MKSLFKTAMSEAIEGATNKVVWPDEYVNRKTGKPYTPQHEEINQHIYEPASVKHLYIMAGEGSGKTATLAVMTLEKLRRGLDTVFLCVDLPMLLKVWNEISHWIPKNVVISEHQHMIAESWSPYKAYFEMMFISETGVFTKLIVGGLGNDYGRWESLSVNSIVIDEARHIPSEKIMKIVTGRIRVNGLNGEQPQLVIGSTPVGINQHWLYDYFGNLNPLDPKDRLYDFKKKAGITKLTVKNNLDNLYKGYMEDRALTLTEEEKRIFIDGEWGDLSDDSRFVASMEMWERLHDKNLIPLRKSTDTSKDWSDGVVIALDGAIKDDSFAMVAVSRNPKNRSDVSVRLTHEFKPQEGKVDFKVVENKIREWCDTYDVITVVFDIYQIYDLTERLRKEGIAWFQEFSQMNKRTLADNLLYELILQGRLSHSGQEDLREHIKNAGYKYDAREMKRRIVKIQKRNKIDLVICTAMATYECLRLNL